MVTINFSTFLMYDQYHNCIDVIISVRVAIVVMKASGLPGGKVYPKH